LYDGAGNLAGARHNREAAGYKLDATGRVLSVLSGGAGRTVETDEAYRYTRNGLPQETARLTEWQAGRLTQHDDTHYQYDKAGRLIRKQVVQPGYRPQVWHYRWDSRNQLRVVDTPTGERWFYRYDPFGRRTGKRCEQTQDDIRYLWDGDQIAEVRHYRNGERVARRHWVHNGWELLVQQRQNTDGRWETDFVTSSQNGEPQAVFNPQGELRWRAPKSTLWGQRQSHLEENIDPGLAFAGQYRDTESGLCYNRFRYYDPAGGCYVSPDPIGIAGGDNNYGYVPNPNTWVDPLGLAGCEWKSRRTFKDGDSGLKDHARRHSDLSPEKYLERGKRNVSHGSLLKGGGRSPSDNYYVRKLGDNDYSVTITDKNNKILSIDTWKDGGLPMTQDKIIKGLSRSGITPPKGFWGML
ncbi:RHS repeat domain-containing protein, partial [Pectobacterium odoriferum]|uniref:RHS repeat domain-containing protein n=1 Tax=Pectobacterium odoriferum TaxID=78398 RepID=UPI0011AEFCD7